MSDFLTDGSTGSIKGLLGVVLLKASLWSWGSFGETAIHALVGVIVGFFGQLVLKALWNKITSKKDDGQTIKGS